nr:MAG: ribonucleoside-diphosphate reductase alpha chain [Caudoviricetes sp.]
MEEHLGIKIFPERDNLFDTLGIKRLQESYMKDGEISPQERFAFVSKSFGSNLEHAQRLYDYASKHWLSFATPILSYGKSKNGLPISCFLSYMQDSAAGLVDTLSEVNTLSMLGGGVGIGVDIRSADDKSVGVMPHLKIYDASCLAYRQGKTRRGSYAAYLRIDHPDVLMFLEMRKPTGDQNIKCLNLHHGIIVTDKFMNIIEQCMIDPDFDDTWQLYDKHDTNRVRESVSAKELWQKILELRMQTGEPYILFIDTANEQMPEFQKKLGLSIKQSNICSEILLPTDHERTAVCCLSSVNLRYYDDFKDNYQFFRDVAEMLDNVLTAFIDNAPEAISRAKYSAMRERAIGIGTLGFHTYLQQNSIPFECAMAKSRNMQIFKNIRTHLDQANKELGFERGNCPDFEEGVVGEKLYYQRFSHLMAIAPTASTSIIMGNISPSIEPIRANAYRQDTMSGSHLNKNHVLDELIKEKIKGNSKLDYDSIWLDIISNDGSIQHMDMFTDEEKEVFKTAMEIDQRWVVDLASDRQKYIDQTQSVNLFFRPDVNIKYLHAVHFMAWKSGLPTLYYCRSDSLKKSDKVSKQIERHIIEEINLQDIIDGDDCLACQ